MHWDWILKLDWNIICSAVTAISTFLMMVATCFMAVAAWKALNTWREELRINKILEIYNDLFLLFFKIENFLDNLSIIYAKEGEQNCNERIASFSSEIALFISKIKILNNKDLCDSVDFCFKNFQKIFAWGNSQTLENGTIRATYQYETFINRYLHDNNFCKELKESIMKIRQICEEKQYDLYK